jgi:hypothetical protein
MIQKNSFYFVIQLPGSNTKVPILNNLPDFTGFTEPTLSVLTKAWNDFLDSGETLEVIPDPIPEPVVVVPDWGGLSKKCITPGDPLFALYTRLTFAAMDGNTRIAVAQARIETAILTIKDEGALAGGISLLTSPFPTDGVVPYTFYQEEKDDWNPVVAELGFSPLVYI